MKILMRKKKKEQLWSEILPTSEDSTEAHCSTKYTIFVSKKDLTVVFDVAFCC